ncbi:MAG: ATP-binding protein [Amphritea sp.]
MTLPQDQEMNSISLQRGVMGTLSTRLTLALIAIVIAVGLSVVVVSQSWMRAYYEELTQKLNINIAMYVTGEYSLLQPEGGQPDFAAINTLAHHAMIINPLAEVYLLDTGGRIIAHALPDAEVRLDTVPLAPIRQFLAEEKEFPLRGADPRHQNLDKVFSVAEIRNGEDLQGYLYVILGGRVYDNIEDSIETSYSRAMVLLAITVIIIAAVLVGALIFSLLVRRLSQLSQQMQRFTETGLQGPVDDVPQAEVPLARDEIDLLAQNFTRMSDKISCQLELLRQGDELRRELISNVSHDLRTPLATIQGYLETLLIKNSDLDQQQRLEYLQIAMQSSNRLGSLISDLFELSKLESNHMTLECEQFSLAELVFDITQEFRLQAEARNIQIRVYNQQQQALVTADISLMQRVFENLLRNAIAYTPENGEILVQIEPDSSNQRGAVTKVSIIDNGRGISAEDLPYIFDRFYVNPDRNSMAEGSTGLGLAIVKRILDLHQTGIQVQSQLNQGSCFQFTLPKAA